MSLRGRIQKLLPDPLSRITNQMITTTVLIKDLSANKVKKGSWEVSLDLEYAQYFKSKDRRPWNLKEESSTASFLNPCNFQFHFKY